MRPCVVFDLDGTLADTSADLIAAANACFEERGQGAPLDPVADALTAFQGGRAMLRLGAQRLDLGEAAQAAAQIEADYPRLLDHYERHIDRFTRLYPGAAQALRDLKAAGYALAVCTNKPEGLARSLLSRLGVAALFDAIVGADRLPVRKPDPAPYHLAVHEAGGAGSLLVGDTQTDYATARAAGVAVILVGFGPEGAAIERLGADAILPDYAALPALVARLLPLS